MLGALWRCWTPKTTRAGVRYFAGSGRDLSHPSSFTQRGNPNPWAYHAVTSVKIADHFRCSTVNFLLLVNSSFEQLLHSGSLGTWPSLRIFPEPGPFSHETTPLPPRSSNSYFHRFRAPHSGSVVARRQATLIILLGGAGFQGTLAARPDEVKHPWAAAMYLPRFFAAESLVGRICEILEKVIRLDAWSLETGGPAADCQSCSWAKRGRSKYASATWYYFYSFSY